MTHESLVVTRFALPLCLEGRLLMPMYPFLVRLKCSAYLSVLSKRINMP